MAVAAYFRNEPERAVALASRLLQLEGENGDGRVLLLVAGLDELVDGPDEARSAWKRLRDVLRERLSLTSDQPADRTYLMQALVQLGESDAALAEWDRLRPLLDAPDSIAINL